MDDREDREFSEQFSDNPITVLGQCLSDCKLHFEHTTPHRLVLQANGKWDIYPIAFDYNPEQKLFSTSGELPLALEQHQIDQVHLMLGRLNSACGVGHYLLDPDRRRIVYRHAMPETLFYSLELATIEDLISATLEALENLYPVAISLLKGFQSIEDALAKHLCPAEGHA